MVAKANALNVNFNPKDIIYAPNGSSLTGLTTTADAVMTGDSTNTPTWVSMAADGALLIGSAAGAPLGATLTQGPGILITNAANSITIASAGGGGFTWNDITTATANLVVQNGYVTNRGAGVAYTLPATAVLGDQMIIVGKLGLTTVNQNANQQILIAGSSSTIGVLGSISGINVGNCITLTCITAGAATVWRASSLVGNWNVV